jgi:glycerate 2-kinase
MRNLRADALRIYFKTLERVSVSNLVRDKVLLEGSNLLVEDSTIDLSQYEEIVLVGLGKASIQMASALLELIPGRVVRGVVVASRRWPVPMPASVSTIIGGHPIPTAESVEGARLILEAVSSCTDRSLLLFLVSGGGSALAELPVSDSISLDDLQTLNRLLVESEATIREINTVRKMLSRIKSGRLGYLARNRRGIAFYLSDVNSGDLRTIASNPLLPEQTTRQDLDDVLDRYHLRPKLPSSIERALEGGTVEAPSGWDFTQGLTTVLLADNSTAIRTAADVAAGLGFVVQFCDDLVEDSYQSIASEMAVRLKALKIAHPREPVCLLSGGESVCPVHGNGVGGRNQEFVLYSASSLKQSGLENTAVVFCAGTDGVDGNSTAAGAVMGFGSAVRAFQRDCNPSVFIDNSDSHAFFSKAGGLVVTGPTGNNVRDIRMMLAC